MKPETSQEDSIEFHPYGVLKYKKSEGGWFGTLGGIVPDNRVEILIEGNRDESPSQKLEAIREFIAKLSPLMNRLFDHIHQKFLKSRLEKDLEELRDMYFLAAISLKKDEETFWVVLEPGFNVDSIFNHFIRFTIVGDSIAWSNISKGKI